MKLDLEKEEVIIFLISVSVIISVFMATSCERHRYDNDLKEVIATQAK